MKIKGQEPTLEDWLKQMTEDLRNFAMEVKKSYEDEPGKFMARQSLGSWDEDFQDWQNKKNKV